MSAGTRASALGGLVFDVGGLGPAMKSNVSGSWPGLPLLALLFAAISLPAHAADPDPEARYQTLLAAARAGDQPVDWQALRFAYADRPTFNVLGDGLDDVRKRMFAALDADYSSALSLAGQITDQDFVDLDAHFIAFVCYVRMGQPDRGVRDRDIGLGLIRSIQTGDGKAPASALSVITVAEEYSYLRASGLRPTRQALIHNGAHSYDLLDTVDQSGQPHPVYFLIDRILADEAKAFKPKG